MFERVESSKDHEKKLISQLSTSTYRFSPLHEYFHRIEAVESVLFVLLLQLSFHSLSAKESSH